MHGRKGRGGHETSGFLADDGGATGDFLLALAQGVVGNGLQIVNIVEKDVLKEVDGRDLCRAARRCR